MRLKQICVGAKVLSISDFLRAVISTSNPQYISTRDAVRDAVYEYTTPFTTRPMRKGELNGREYLFVTKSQFEQLVNADRMLEWGERSGNYYGTPKLLNSDLASAVPAIPAGVRQGRRPTLAEAVQAGPKEASLATLLEHVEVGSEAEKALEQTPSELLNSDVADEKMKKVRESIKQAIYDMTIPLTTRPPRPGEKHGVQYNFV